MALPFVTQAICVALGVVLVSRDRHPAGARPAGDRQYARDIADGIRWLLEHAPVRTLALVMLTFNLTFGAAWSVMVLYSTRLLGMSDVGYGPAGPRAPRSAAWSSHLCLRLARAAHGLGDPDAHLLDAGGAVSPGVRREPPRGRVRPDVRFGSYAFVWETRRPVGPAARGPDRFQGRVGQVYSVGLYGGSSSAWPRRR